MLVLVISNGFVHLNSNHEQSAGIKPAMTRNTVPPALELGSDLQVSPSGV